MAHIEAETMRRDTNKGIQQYAQDGRQLYQAMYGNTADSVQNLLDATYPDLGELKQMMDDVQHF